MNILLLVENTARKGGVTKTTKSLYEKLDLLLGLNMSYFGVFPECFLVGWKRWLSFLIYPIFLIRLNRIINIQQVDKVVCSHFVPIISIFLLNLFRKGKVDVINWLHIDLESYALERTISSYIYCYVIPKVLKFKNTKTIFVSKESEKRTCDLYGLINTQTIYNIIFANKSYNSPDFHNKELIFIGSFEKRKRLTYIIESLNYVHESISLRIVGGDKTSLVDFVNGLGLQRRVKFLGYTDPHKYLNKSSALILASTSEGFPLVLLEANAYNLPVISTDFKTGIREYFGLTDFASKLSHDINLMTTGVLVNSSNGKDETIKNLSNAINLIFDNEKVYNSMVRETKKEGENYDCNSIVSEWAKNFGLR
ncbi:hypothetical protein VCHA37P192_110168 [Vibrio chagasii]|nr:hypothetical protein VCHA37P192_110168 [Vibrio chagasii]